MADQLRPQARESLATHELQKPEPTFRNLFLSRSGNDASKSAIQDAVRSRLTDSIVVPRGVSRDVNGRLAIPEGDADPTAYSALLTDRVVPYAVNTRTPRSMGHMTTIVPEFVHELGQVLMTLNQNMVKRDASGSFTELERETIAMMHRLAFDRPDGFYREYQQNVECSLGMFCSGGTVANLTALWIARNDKLRGGKDDGIEAAGIGLALERAGYKSAVIVGSNLMHYSVRKAAGLLGLGERNVQLVPVDERGRIRPGVCRDVLKRCDDAGSLVVALIGVAGTTDYGSIDPLDDLADLANECSIHYHVDAAWGGTLLFSRTHRDRLRGIERADSVTIDPHKQMYVPIGTSLLLLRDPYVAQTIQQSSDYMLHEGSGDLGRYSVEGSRPASSLYVHAALHIIGRRGYERFIDGNIAMARFMARRIEERIDFELLAEPETNIVLYRYVPLDFGGGRARGSFATESQDRINRFNVSLHHQQMRGSGSLVSRTTLRHPRYSEPVVALRAVIANPLTGENDVCALLDEQTDIAGTL